MASDAEQLRAANRTNDTGNDLLRTGLMVGAIGVGGALLGAVCPLCVVATPTLLGLGAVQKLRALVATRRLKSAI
jgi:hypothetical protein